MDYGRNTWDIGIEQNNTYRDKMAKIYNQNEIKRES